MHLARPLFCLYMLILATPALAWDNERDSKPVEELALMNDQELFSQALNTCIYLTSYWHIKPQFPNQGEAYLAEQDDKKMWPAKRYLDRIGLVARQRNKGTMPWWVDELKAAGMGDHGDQCLAISNRFMGEYSKKSQPTKTKKTKH